MVRAEGRVGRGQVPVKMFWNASSTLLASRADVSMNERWFSPVHKVNAWISLHVFLAPHRTAPQRTCRAGGQTHSQTPWPPLLAQPVDAANRSCYPPA